MVYHFTVNVTIGQLEWKEGRTTEWMINKLLVECEKCGMVCSVKRYRNYSCSTAHEKGIKVWDTKKLR